jgi:hypothetical protein
MHSEMHPVGFRKYILIAASGYRLRLHVWRGPGNDSRHNHRWWFVSMPLIGCFVETRYRERPGDDFLKIAVYDEGAMRDRGRVYRQSGDSGLDVVRIRSRYPLIPYLCRIGEIHSFVPRGSGLHVSLVLVGRLCRETSDIWRSPDNLDIPLDSDETSR